MTTTVVPRHHSSLHPMLGDERPRLGDGVSEELGLRSRIIDFGFSDETFCGTKSPSVTHEVTAFIVTGLEHSAFARCKVTNDSDKARCLDDIQVCRALFLRDGQAAVEAAKQGTASVSPLHSAAIFCNEALALRFCEALVDFRVTPFEGNIENDAAFSAEEAKARGDAMFLASMVSGMQRNQTGITSLLLAVIGRRKGVAEIISRYMPRTVFGNIRNQGADFFIPSNAPYNERGFFVAKTIVLVSTGAFIRNASQAHKDSPCYDERVKDATAAVLKAASLSVRAAKVRFEYGRQARATPIDFSAPPSSDQLIVARAEKRYATSIRFAQKKLSSADCTYLATCMVRRRIAWVPLATSPLLEAIIEGLGDTVTSMLANAAARPWSKAALGVHATRDFLEAGQAAILLRMLVLCGYLTAAAIVYEYLLPTSSLQAPISALEPATCQCSAQAMKFVTSCRFEKRAPRLEAFKVIFEATSACPLSFREIVLYRDLEPESRLALAINANLSLDDRGGVLYSRFPSATPLRRDYFLKRLLVRPETPPAASSAATTYEVPPSARRILPSSVPQLAVLGKRTAAVALPLSTARTRQGVARAPDADLRLPVDGTSAAPPLSPGAEEALAATSPLESLDGANLVLDDALLQQWLSML